MTAIPTRTRAEIRRDVGYLLYGRDKFAVAPVLTGSTTLITVDVAKRWPNDWFNGASVFAVSGTGAGQQRNITDHDQATGALAPGALWAPALDNTTMIEIWPAGSDPDTINSNINLAVQRASDIVNVYTEVPFAGFDSDLMSATIPPGIVKVVGAYYYENQIFTDFYHESWLNSQGGGGFIVRGNKMYFNRALSNSVAVEDITLQGYRLPIELDADDDTAEVRPDYLTFMAAFYTEAGQAGGQTLDPEQHSARAGQWLKEALAIEPRMVTDWQPNTVEVPGNG